MLARERAHRPRPLEDQFRLAAVAPNHDFLVFGVSDTPSVPELRGVLQALLSRLERRVWEALEPQRESLLAQRATLRVVPAIEGTVRAVVAPLVEFQSLGDMRAAGFLLAEIEQSRPLAVVEEAAAQPAKSPWRARPMSRLARASPQLGDVPPAQ
jgi:hypothetical protein